MSEQGAFDAAARRLALALDALDAAVERRLDAERGGTRLAEQLHAASADRSRLAADLDAQTARARRLESANRDVARRLEAAIANVSSVLDKQAS